jgi:hypothetical protein
MPFVQETRPGWGWRYSSEAGSITSIPTGFRFSILFLQKPVSVEILLSAVRKVLDRKVQEKLEINEEVQR